MAWLRYSNFELDDPRKFKYSAPSETPDDRLESVLRQLSMAIRLRRVVDKPDKVDAGRVPVDRLWPRGLEHIEKLR